MKKKSLTIAASVLTANFLSLKNELQVLQSAGINWIHFDIMDHHFVPNLSFGPKILSDICQFSANLNIDCHFMVKITTTTVMEYCQPFIVNPQVKNITFHYEALTPNQLQEFLNWKNDSFKKGLAINPDTDIANIYQYLPLLDTVLIMSVQPGAGGQLFLTSTLTKIKSLVKVAIDYPHLTIAVDGGINDITAAACIGAGANFLVAGNYLLNSTNNIKTQVDKLTNNGK